MRDRHYHSFAHAYQDMARTILTHGRDAGPRGKATKEILDARLRVDGFSHGVFASPTRSTDLQYLAGELLWYFTGSARTSNIARFSRFWERISEGGRAHSAYGDLLFNLPGAIEINGHRMSPEWAWAFDSLKADPETRQAVMVLNRPEHHYVGNKDQVCTLSVHFMIRDGALDLRTVMRSQDIWFGLTYDAPFFLALLRSMTDLLRRDGGMPELRVGAWIHGAHSLHAYEKDWRALQALSRTDLAVTRDGPVTLPVKPRTRVFTDQLYDAPLPLLDPLRSPIDAHGEADAQLYQTARAIRHASYQGSPHTVIESSDAAHTMHDDLAHWIIMNAKPRHPARTVVPT